MKKVNKDGMRQNNIRLVYETIYRNEGITRTQLVEKTRMSDMTVGRTVDFLLKNDLISDKPNENTSDVGRPASRLFLSHRFVNVGVSLDPGGVFIGMVDSYGNVLHFSEQRFLPESLDPTEALGIVAALIERFIDEHVPEGLHTIGVVVPGLVDCRNGLVRLSPQLGWTDIPVLEILKGHPNLPNVALDNDIKARALGENRFGSEEERRCSVLLNIGSGIGAGIVIDGEIYRGKENYAGEIGHTALSMSDRICKCGRKGCIEAIFSQPAILREARTIAPDIKDIAGIEAAYAQGETWARALLDMTTEGILAVIRILAHTYAPDANVLCGSLIDQCSVLRDKILELCKGQHSEMFNNLFDLEFSKFGPNGNLIGAAAIAFDYNIMHYIVGAK